MHLFDRRRDYYVKGVSVLNSDAINVSIVCCRGGESYVAELYSNTIPIGIVV